MLKKTQIGCVGIAEGKRLEEMMMYVEELEYGYLNEWKDLQVRGRLRRAMIDQMSIDQTIQRRRSRYGLSQMVGSKQAWKRLQTLIGRFVDDEQRPMDDDVRIGRKQMGVVVWH